MILKLKENKWSQRKDFKLNKERFSREFNRKNVKVSNNTYKKIHNNNKVIKMKVKKSLAVNK